MRMRNDGRKFEKCGRGQRCTAGAVPDCSSMRKKTTSSEERRRACKKSSGGIHTMADVVADTVTLNANMLVGRHWQCLAMLYRCRSSMRRCPIAGRTDRACSSFPNTASSSRVSKSNPGRYHAGDLEKRRLKQSRGPLLFLAPHCGRARAEVDRIKAERHENSTLHLSFQISVQLVLRKERRTVALSHRFLSTHHLVSPSTSSPVTSPSHHGLMVDSQPKVEPSLRFQADCADHSCAFFGPRQEISCGCQGVERAGARGLPIKSASG